MCEDLKASESPAEEVGVDQGDDDVDDERSDYEDIDETCSPDDDEIDETRL